MIRRARARWGVPMLAVPVLLTGCKPSEPACNPDSVDWTLQLAIQTAELINPTEGGESLPTVVRVFQLRGELAIDDLEFDALWQAAEASELGESFLSMEEMTLFPARDERRELPIEDGATHVLAASLVRKPAGKTWYASYALPLQHADVVCAKEPETQRYPDPCFYLRLDRSALDGGATPPAGYVAPSGLQCAPLDAAPPATNEKSRKDQRRKARRKRGKDVSKDELQQRLDGASKGEPPKAPRTPERPELPKPELPKPELPSGPKVPSVPRR